MDDIQYLRAQWARAHYLNALRAAWKMVATKAYTFQDLKRLPDLSLRDLVVAGCRHVVALAWQQRCQRNWVQKWLDGFLQQVSDPAFFSDVDEEEGYYHRMIRTYLLCTQAALEREWTSGCIPTATIERVAQETGETRSFIRDLTWELLPKTIRATQPQHQTVATTLPALLVRGNHGVVADLVLELVPDGAGVLYRAPEVALIPRDDKFRQAEDNARACLMTYKLWRNDRDVRWRLTWRATDAAKELIGPSLGGAFALGMAKLLAGE